MKPIPIPISLCPHVVNGKPRGYYIIAQAMFPNGQPILFRQQFVGFTRNIVLTVAHPGKWDTLLKMALYVPKLGDLPVHWVSATKMYPTGPGVRIYLPGTVLKPASAECKKIDTLGSLCRAYLGDLKDGIYYVDIPKLNADILLGREELR